MPLLQLADVSALQSVLLPAVFCVLLPVLLFQKFSDVVLPCLFVCVSVHLSVGCQQVGRPACVCQTAFLASGVACQVCRQG